MPRANDRPVLNRKRGTGALQASSASRMRKFVRANRRVNIDYKARIDGMRKTMGRLATQIRAANRAGNAALAERLTKNRDAVSKQLTAAKKAFDKNLNRRKSRGGSGG